MRQIRFRGLSEGKWYYGLLTFMFSSYAIVDPKDENTVHLVDVKTVGQYTGLKDENGVEIYEGDILDFTLEQHYDGIYQEMNYKQSIIFSEGSFWAGYNLLHEVIYADVELMVIGNIYENPELLEEITK